MSEQQSPCILEVKDLAVEFPFRQTSSKAVNGVNFKIHAGESIGIVGESGCGKTITSYSTMGLLPSGAKLTSGEIWLTKADGRKIDIAKEPPDSKELLGMRGNDISVIFQEPASALSPIHTMANQICEAILVHQRVGKEEARKMAIDLFKMVGIPQADKRIDEYPFQFSGGMMQRAMIAMALACKPRILIADEPTTALDVTIQAQVLMLIRKMQKELGLSLMLITHNMGIVAHMVDRLYVMYMGKVVEQGAVADIFNSPKHPYTKALLNSIPRLGGARRRLESIRGTVPSGFNLPKGCSFHERCQESLGELCATKQPQMTEMPGGRCVRCFLYSREEEVQ